MFTPPLPAASSPANGSSKCWHKAATSASYTSSASTPRRVVPDLVTVEPIEALY